MSRVMVSGQGEGMPGVTHDVPLLRELRPYLRHCGDERRPAWYMGPRRLLDFLLVYIAEGQGRFGIDGVTYDARPGDLFWIPPDTVHEMGGDAPGMTCPYVHFDLLYRPEVSHWDFSIPPGLLDLSELRALQHPPVTHLGLDRLTGRLRLHNGLHVGELVRQTCAEALRAQPYAALKASGLLLTIVAEILRGLDGLDERAGEHVPALEAAGEWLRRYCHTPASLERLARDNRLSPGHFRALFLRHYGVSPRTYLRQMRVQKAKELMTATHLNLSEIALESGFGSVFSFSRAFHESEGVAPSQWRRCGPEARVRVTGRHTPYGH